MTKADFVNSKRKFQREISWTCMAWFVLWVVPFFAVGAGFRYWFHAHEMISNVFLVVGILAFLVPVWFIAKFLREKHRLVCRSCGQWLLLDPRVSATGKCSKCQVEIFHDA